MAFHDSSIKHNISDTAAASAPPQHQISLDPARELPANNSSKAIRLFTSRSGLFKKRSDLSEDARRDSGMAPSLTPSTDQADPADGPSNAGLANPTSTSSAPAVDPSVPSIVLNDEKLTLMEARPNNAALPMPSAQINGQASESPTNDHFTGITTDIPTGELDDPFSSKLQFSKRGSVLLSKPEADAVLKPIPKSNSVRSTFSNRSSMSATERRLANPQRVSAEDRRLSRKVRSYYEPDNEILLEEPDDIDQNPDVAFKGEKRDTVPGLPPSSPPRKNARDDHTRRPSITGSPSKRTSTRMEPNEAAGGIEDWTDVDSRDVDRFGFIRPRPASSKRSSIGSGNRPGTADPPQSSRVGTPLSTVDEVFSAQPNGHSQPKKKNRLSLNPGGDKALRSSPSLLSSKSKASSVRSRTTLKKPRKNQPRWLANAPDMLLPPPGFGEDAADPNLNPARESRRADKWQKMAKPVPTQLSEKGAGMKYTFQVADPKLISRVWKGIPNRWRSEAWHAFLSASAARRSSTKDPQPSDEELEQFFVDCQELDCSDDVQIDMDVPRTIGNHLQFRKRYHGGQRFLFRVLRALSLYFPDTGYVQGMASVVATLLVYYDESRAFVMAVRLWQLRGIGHLYTEGFEGLLSALQELEDRWIKNTAVATQLESLSIHASAWGPKWYLTLFNYVLPFHTMLRVWDVFILLGDAHPTSGGDDATLKPNYDVLHAVSAAMLSALRDTIVGSDFENAMRGLTSPVPVGKDDKLMNIAKRLYDQKKTTK